MYDNQDLTSWPWNLPLLTSDPDEQAEIWVLLMVSTSADPGSLSTNTVWGVVGYSCKHSQDSFL